VLSTLSSNHHQQLRLNKGMDGEDTHHVGESDTRILVLFSDSSASVEEETITELHNVGLVDSGNVLQDEEAAK